MLPHPSKCEYESDLEVEMEGDAFASNLLMPSHRFLTRVRSGKVGLRTILDLAAHFEASVTSAAVRYVRADIVPCAVVKWAPDGLLGRSDFKLGPDFCAAQPRAPVTD